MDNFNSENLVKVSPHLIILYAKDPLWVPEEKLRLYEKEFSWPVQNNLEIPKIDSLHKMMFETAVLVRLITRGQIGGDYKKGFDFLLNLIKEHFRIEECLMRAKNYSKVNSHEDWYQEFLAWLDAKSYTNVTSISNEIYEKVFYIEEWIVDHIFDFDLLYAEWLKENKV